MRGKSPKVFTISNKRNLTTGSLDMQKIIKNIIKQFIAIKATDKMGVFLKKYKLPTLNQEETDTVSKPRS